MIETSHYARIMVVMFHLLAGLGMYKEGDSQSKHTALAVEFIF